MDYFILSNFEKIFENFQNISQENWGKCSILAYFSKNLANHWLITCALDENHRFLEILRKFSKGFRKFLKKIAKNALCLHIFGKDLANHQLVFSHLDENQNLLGILRKLSKVFKRFLKKIAKKHYFSTFFKET